MSFTSLRAFVTKNDDTPYYVNDRKTFNSLIHAYDEHHGRQTRFARVALKDIPPVFLNQSCEDYLHEMVEESLWGLSDMPSKALVVNNDLTPLQQKAVGRLHSLNELMKDDQFYSPITIHQVPYGHNPNPGKTRLMLCGIRPYEVVDVLYTSIDGSFPDGVDWVTCDDFVLSGGYQNRLFRIRKSKYDDFDFSVGHVDDDRFYLTDKPYSVRHDRTMVYLNGRPIFCKQDGAWKVSETDAPTCAARHVEYSHTVDKKCGFDALIRDEFNRYIQESDYLNETSTWFARLSLDDIDKLDTQVSCSDFPDMRIRALIDRFCPSNGTFTVQIESNDTLYSIKRMEAETIWSLLLLQRQPKFLTPFTVHALPNGHRVIDSGNTRRIFSYSRTELVDVMLTDFGGLEHDPIDLSSWTTCHDHELQDYSNIRIRSAPLAGDRAAKLGHEDTSKRLKWLKNAPIHEDYKIPNGTSLRITKSSDNIAVNDRPLCYLNPEGKWRLIPYG